MSDVETENLIAYLQKHGEEIREQCRFLIEITRVAEAIDETVPESSVKFAGQLREQKSKLTGRPLLTEHERWWQGLLTRIYR